MLHLYLRAAFGVVAVLVLTAAIGCSQREVPRAQKLSTTPDDAFAKLLDLDDKPVDLKGSSPGQVHVIVFIRSDCPISNRMAPEIRDVNALFKSQGVDFFLIYVDPREQPAAIQQHLTEYELTCPALRDPYHAIVAETGASVTPEAVVFDRDWKVTYQGRINDQFEDLGKSRETPTKHDLRDAVAATLAGKPVAEPRTKAIGCYIDDLK
jgi:redoxin